MVQHSFTVGHSKSLVVGALVYLLMVVIISSNINVRLCCRYCSSPFSLLFVAIVVTVRRRCFFRPSPWW